MKWENGAREEMRGQEKRKWGERCAIGAVLQSNMSHFQSHAQYVRAVCLAGHTSCKHGGMYE